MGEGINTKTFVVGLVLTVVFAVFNAAVITDKFDLKTALVGYVAWIVALYVFGRWAKRQPPG